MWIKVSYEKKADVPALGKVDLYILNDSLNEVKLEEISDYMDRSGYTQEIYQNNMKAMGIASAGQSEALEMVVPVEYSLQEDGFSAKILTDKITVTGTCHLYSVNLLEYFDSMNQSSEGYFYLYLCRTAPDHFFR